MGPPEKDLSFVPSFGEVKGRGRRVQTRSTHRRSCLRTDPYLRRTYIPTGQTVRAPVLEVPRRILGGPSRSRRRQSLFVPVVVGPGTIALYSSHRWKEETSLWQTGYLLVSGDPWVETVNRNEYRSHDLSDSVHSPRTLLFPSTLYPHPRNVTESVLTNHKCIRNGVRCLLNSGLVFSAPPPTPPLLCYCGT